MLASVFVACELEAGAARSSSPDRERTRVRALLAAVAVVYPDDRFAPEYADLLVALHASGRTVDTMGLLIATAASVDAAGLVTANRKHFEAIPGLGLFGCGGAPATSTDTKRAQQKVLRYDPVQARHGLGESPAALRPRGRLRVWLLGLNPLLGDRRPIDLIRAGRAEDLMRAIRAERADSFA